MQSWENGGEDVVCPGLRHLLTWQQRDSGLSVACVLTVDRPRFVSSLKSNFGIFMVHGQTSRTVTSKSIVAKTTAI